MLDPETCWNAVLRKDRTHDGRFLFGVVTTGIYCRPSCGSRTPLRRNVRFYASAGEAERDGLRPCRRCRPAEAAGPDAAGDRIRALCDYIRGHSQEPLTLDDLSRRAGLSRFHLQRSFKSMVGVTPRQFAEACRLEGLKTELRSRASVTEAIYEAGFGSSSRVYERSGRHLGMTPAEYRAGGRGVPISYTWARTAVGLLLAASTPRGLCFARFGRGREELFAELRREFPHAVPVPAGAPLTEWVKAVSRHLAGTYPDLRLPVDVRATAFQIEVWNVLRSIPAGEVRSYAEVARALGRPTAVRAVARACAANPVAIAIPCHRVVRADGQTGGYRWGEERKRRILAREGAARLPDPTR